MKARVLLFGILAAALVFVLAFYNKEENYAVEISGEKVSFGEYMLYLYEQKQMFESIGGKDIWETDFDGLPAEEFAKQKALDSLLYVKLAARQAELRHISLSPEEESETARKTEEMLASASGYYPFELEEVQGVLRQTKLFQKLYEEITSAVETDSPDLKKQFYDSNFEKWRENSFVKKNDEWIAQVDVKTPLIE